MGLGKTTEGQNVEYTKGTIHESTVHQLLLEYLLVHVKKKIQSPEIAKS